MSRLLGAIACGGADQWSNLNLAEIGVNASPQKPDRTFSLMTTWNQGI